MPGDIDRLRSAIEDRSAVVGVVGLGYVGLPVAVEFGKAGFSVVGIGPDRKRVANIFRNVKIAIANELAMLYDRMRISVWEMVEAAAASRSAP